MILPIYYNVDITQPLLPVPLNPMLVTQDALANRIGVRLFEGNTPYSPGGSCAGFAVRRDGATVPIAGTINGNEMYIDLPAAAYALDGPINVGIKNVDGDTETTVFLGMGTVIRGETGTAIDPGTIIPSVAQLLQELRDAAAAIPGNFTELMAAKVDKPTTNPDGQAGQVLRSLGDGGTEWASVGQPTDAQTAAAVAAFLTAHPEYTTTVEDGSLTYKKLALGTLGFVIPEMYGAKGDGVTDDTAAINAALANNRVVFLLPHTYRTTEPIYVPSYTSLIGLDREKSRIYNTGLGYMKNAVLCGIFGGDSADHGIKATNAIAFTKTGPYTFTSARAFQPDDIVHFRVDDADEGISQMLSTSTYITTVDGNTYTTFDPIPDNAELHAYSDITVEYDGLRAYVAFGTRVENLTIEHLPTGSGMYCLFLCGARQIVKNVRTIGNTGIASNLSVHNTWEDVECISYGDNLDCAEYVYYTDYRRVAVRKSSIDASTMHVQLAFGRGHDVRVERFSSNRANGLALSYVKDIVFEDCDLALTEIAQTGAGRNVLFRRCNLYSDEALSLREADYEDCYIQHPNPGVGLGHFSGVVSDDTGIGIVAKSVIHKPGYKDQIFRRIVALSTYTVPKFDNSIWVRVTGSALTISDGTATLTADHEITIIITPGGLVRVAFDGGAFAAPGWSASADLTISGTLGYIEQESLAGYVPA